MLISRASDCDALVSVSSEASNSDAELVEKSAAAAGRVLTLPGPALAAFSRRRRVGRHPLDLNASLAFSSASPI